MRLSTLFSARWLRIVVLLVAYFSLTVLAASAQTTPTWTSVQRGISSGAGGESGGRRMVVGADGSQYVTGAYRGSLTLGSTTLPGTTSGRYTFLAKYNAGGTVLWTNILTGTSDSYVAVDAAGNVYMTGFFTSPLTLGTTTLTLSANNPYDSYLVKYNTQGVQQWVLQGNGAGVNSSGIAVDAGGNVVIAGDYEDTVSFGGPPITTLGGLENIFYYKFSPAGVILQAKRVTVDSNIIVNSMALDGAGNAFIAADFDGVATFGATTLASINDVDMLLCKLDAAGNFLWARRDGGPGLVNSNFAASVAIDATGNAVLAGHYVNGTSSQAYLALYTSQGTQVWSRQTASTGPGYSIVRSVAYDGRGGYLLTGQFQNSVVFGAIPLTAAGIHLFVARYDSQGTAVWADQAVGTSSTDTSAGYGIVADASGNGYAIGNVGGSASFGPLATTPGASVSSTDIVVAKFTVGRALATAHSASSVLAMSCYPNPASGHATLVLPAGGGHLVFMDALGRSVREQKLPANAGEYAVSLSGLAPGFYQLRATLGNGQTTCAQLAVQ